MPRQLWLLRHAEAEPHGARADSERRLTERGEQQARAAGAALARMGADFDLVLTSPKIRSLRTAEIATSECGEELRERLEVDPALSGGFGGEQALELARLTGESGRILLVGHEPDMSDVIAHLTGAIVDMKKGGIAAVRLQGARGELLLLMRPHELALLAGVPVGRN